MNLPIKFLFLLPFLSGVAFGAPAEPADKAALAKQLPESRARYETSLKRKKVPPSNSEEWLQAHVEWTSAHRELAAPLIAYWAQVDPEDAEFEPLHDEIQELLKGAGGTSGLKTYFLSQVWRALADPNIEAEHAKQLTKLAKPGGDVRISDLIKGLGITPEPLGWDEQSTYALGLIRCGKLRAAETEIEKLKAKIGTRPGKLDFDSEAGDHRHRSYLDYRQTCYLLHGVLARAHKDEKRAQHWYSEAKKLRPDSFSPEGQLLAEELQTP